MSVSENFSLQNTETKSLLLDRANFTFLGVHYGMATFHDPQTEYVEDGKPNLFLDKKACRDLLNKIKQANRNPYKTDTALLDKTKKFVLNDMFTQIAENTDVLDIHAQRATKRALTKAIKTIGALKKNSSVGLST